MFYLQNAENPTEASPAKTSPLTETEPVTSTEIREDSYVYVHCYLPNYSKDAMVRIWKTTYLVDKTSGHKSELVHAENISFAPQWTPVQGSSYSFLLIFSGLPKSCFQFDMIEEIEQPGGFLVKDIQRNETDVYHVDL